MLKIDIKDDLELIENETKRMYEKKTDEIKKDIGHAILTFILMIVCFVIMYLIIANVPSDSPTIVIVIASIGLMLPGCIGSGALFVFLAMCTDIKWSKKYNKIHAENGDWMTIAFNYSLVKMNFLSLYDIKNLREEQIKEYSLEFDDGKKILSIAAPEKTYRIFLDRLELPHNMEKSDMLLKIDNNKIILVPV